VLRCSPAARSFGCVIDKRKAEVAAYAAAAFVVVLLAMRLLQHDAGGSPASPRVSLSPSPPGAPGGTANAPVTGATTRLLVVDVAGEVRRPGVYRLPAGSRADAAVREAGGVTRRGESAAVNLAMPLHDGQQIVVPGHGAVAAATVGGGGPASATSGAAAGQPISLSTATAEQLDSLDGIGPTLAGRIVQYRDAHGGFRSVDELRQVAGIGDKRLQALRKTVQP
jgi:competence protein ComEA